MKTVALYLRCSTDRQDVELQRRDLFAYCARHEDWTVTEYVDIGQSGAKESRPALDRMMDDVRHGKVDIVCVWRYDRLGRSLSHLIKCFVEFKKCKVEFISYIEAIDTSTPHGELFFNVACSFAQFERKLIAQRVRAGLATARANGAKLGRPLKRVDPDKIRALRSEGLTWPAIAKRMRVCQSLVERAVR
jgi:DNA invertase Pin-like site-specific DNA recombinase